MSATPQTTPPDDQARLALPRIVAFFESLAVQDLAHLHRVYAPDARFKDPFNDVRGTAAIKLIFVHMFDQLDAPRFTVLDRVAEGGQIFLTWDFCFRFKGDDQTQTIHGASRLRLDADGLVADHRDYWDAAEELYEKLPVVGAFMRWLKRRVMKGG